MFFYNKYVQFILRTVAVILAIIYNGHYIDIEFPIAKVYYYIIIVIFSVLMFIGLIN